MNNTQLVAYGIQQEDPDIVRLHVSYKTKKVYAFPVKSVLKIMHRPYREGKTSTGRIVTGVGKLIPPKDIDGLKIYQIPSDLLPALGAAEMGNTTVKGNAAVQIAKTMIARRIIAVESKVKVITDINLQIKGFDICVENAARFQVKCDWTAGTKEDGGSGNLFIQTKECNPFQLY